MTLLLRLLAIQISLAVLLCGFAATSPAFAQTTRPSIAERERFICAERVVLEDGRPAPGHIRQLRWLDPLSGKARDPQGFGVRGPREFLRTSLLDARGRALLELHAIGDLSRGGRIGLTKSEPGAPTAVFETNEATSVWPSGAISPDGTRIVFFDHHAESLVIGDTTNAHRIPTQWIVTHPFSWRPDSKQVTFYYASGYDGDDLHIQNHGIATLSADGQLRELVKASDTAGTPDGMGKYMGPLWGPSGRFIYYTSGLPLDDPDRNSTAMKMIPGRSAAYRVQVDTGRTERIGLGELASVSPDERYVLLFCSPVPQEDGRWGVGTTKVDLETRKATYLPAGISYPKISPSGELMATLALGAIHFFDTKDWKPHGQPIPREPHVTPEEWGREYRWIVIE